MRLLYNDSILFKNGGENMKDFLFDYGERNPVPLQHRSWEEEGKGRRSLRLKREDQLNLDEIWLSVSNPIRKPSDICVNAV